MKLTKQDIRAIRYVLGVTQKEFAEMIGVSLPHISRTERDSHSKHAYGVSKKLKMKIIETLESFDMSVEQVLEIAKRSGFYE